MRIHMDDAAMLSRIRSARLAPEVSLTDAQHLVRMVHDGDLVHVDQIAPLLREWAAMGLDLPKGVYLEQKEDAA